jgi:hypothetical protein
MSIENFHRFLFEVGFPLGISSMRVSDFTKVIKLLDICTFENKKYIFFYDALTELTKYYMIQKTINDEFGQDKMFKNNEETIEEKRKLFESLNNE